MRPRISSAIRQPRRGLFHSLFWDTRNAHQPHVKTSSTCSIFSRGENVTSKARDRPDHRRVRMRALSNTNPARSLGAVGQSATTRQCTHSRKPRGLRLRVCPRRFGRIALSHRAALRACEPRSACEPMFRPIGRVPTVLAWPLVPQLQQFVEAPARRRSPVAP